MKKITTLLFFSGLFTASFAQTNRWDNDHDRDRNSAYHTRYEADEKRQQIERVNYLFSRRIEQVQHDRSLNRREKKFAIRALESQRADQVRNINRYNSNVYNDRNNRDRDYRNGEHR